MEAKIFVDRNGPRVVYRIYVPDGDYFWKVDKSVKTEKEAIEYCKKNNYKIKKEN